MAYPFQTIEPKWQQYWAENQTFKTGDDFSKPKYYVLDMFPYPSGAGLHIGHPEGYTATDITSRFKRMKGYNVLHPMGFDAFGLPTERYSMTTGIHPRIATENNIVNFKRQLNSLGLDYDWSREINTTEPDYYKWTQWIFLKIYNSWYDEREDRARPIEELPIPDSFKTAQEIEEYKDSKRLAFIAMIPVNWCEGLGTVLANEEVDEWKEKGYTVERRPMRQWMLRITAYADRLLKDLDLIDWPTSTKEMQRHWIGKSEGAEIDFTIAGSDKRIRVFTTRPDTIGGATYLVLAPEHALVDEITPDDFKSAIAEYQQKSALKSDLERTELSKEKTGVFTGAYAMNPATGERVQIWIADYVLAHYGTGAIMAVPAHDERDHEFATAFHLPIVQVVTPKDGGEFDVLKSAFTDEGLAAGFKNNLTNINGLITNEAKKSIISWLKMEGIGEKKIQFKLRDWLFSRQRYWGEPVPIMFFDDGTKRSLDEDELPLTLPDVKEYKPAGTGESPLATVAEWVSFTDKKTGKHARLETNTMPQWAGSCWYYLRFISPHDSTRFVDAEAEKYWMDGMGVDLYVGGGEHAVLHLLYARFWHKFLYDYGLVSSKEPFKKLYHQGMILGEMEFWKFVVSESSTAKNDPTVGQIISAEEATEEESGGYICYSKRNGQNEPLILVGQKLTQSEVVKSGEHFVLKDNPQIRVLSKVFKMSKSRGNVVSPDTIVAEYGADSLRLYEMFLGPLEAVKPWSSTGIEGVHRFLNRAWRLIASEEGELLKSVQDVPLMPEQEFVLHTTIKKVGEDIENLSFNTAISQMMICVNEFTSAEVRPREAMEKFVLCLAPFAPHMCEELWRILGHTESIAHAKFPDYDEAKLVQSNIEIVFQVNSKIRGKANVPAGTSSEELEKIALADENVQRFMEGKQVRKKIIVPDKLVNLIVG